MPASWTDGHLSSELGLLGWFSKIPAGGWEPTGLIAVRPLSCWAPTKLFGCFGGNAEEGSVPVGFIIKPCMASNVDYMTLNGLHAHRQGLSSLAHTGIAHICPSTLV